MTRLEAALKYAQQGFLFLPVWWITKSNACACPKGKDCPTPGKHPIQAKWQRLATTGPAKIKELLLRYPKAHIGIMPPPGHSITDIDPRNGGKTTFEALRGKNAMPKTVTQQSGGGGVHLFFDGEPVGPLGKGIDVKRNGRGYVVAYPSAHESGGSYKWKRAPWDFPMLPLPPWLSGGKPVASAQGDATVRPSLQAVRAALAHIPADDYNTWIKYGQAIKRDYGESGKPVWIEWGQQSNKWKLSDAAKWATFDKNIGTRPVTVATILAEARKYGYAPEFSAVDNSSIAPAIEVQHSADIAARDLPPLKEFVPDMVTAGLTVIAGRAKLGKSWLMLQLATRLREGGEFLGRPVKRAQVLYLALEDSDRRMQSRMRKLGAARANFDVSFQAPRMDQGLPEALSALIEKHRYEVVIIDTLAAIAPAGNGGKGIWAGDYGVVAALQRVASEHNAAILLVTHTKKNADKGDAQDAIVTTTGVLAGADAYWVFQKPGHDMVLTVRGRDIKEGEYALRFDRDTATWEMLGRAGQIVTSTAQQEILGVLRTHSQPFKWAELKKASGVGDAFDISLKRLVERGLVEQRKDRRYCMVEFEKFGSAGHGR